MLRRGRPARFPAPIASSALDAPRDRLCAGISRRDGANRNGRTIRVAACCAGLAALFAGTPALAQPQTYPYPTAGQTPRQQERDRWECHYWAVQRAGFDPNAPASAASAPAPGGGKEGAGQGPAVQSGAGGALAMMRQRRKARAQEAKQAPADPAQTADQRRAARLQGYYDSYNLCMSARNYTIR